MRVKTVVLYGLGEIIGKLILFLIIPLYARYLTVSDFGVVMLLLPVVQLLQGAAGLGLSLGILKYYYDLPHRRGEVYWNVLISWSAAMTFLGILIIPSLLFADYLNWYRVGNYVLSDFIVWLLIGVLGFALNQIAIQIYQAEENVEYYVALNTGGKVLMAILTAYYLLCFDNVSSLGVFKAIAIASFIVGAGAFITLYRRSVRRIEFALWKKLLILGLPTVFSGISSYILVAGNRIIVNNVLDSEAVAIYGLIYSLSQALSLFTAVFSRVNAPELFKRLSAAKDISQYLKKSSVALMTSITATTFVICFGTEWVLKVIGKSEYVAGLQFMPIVLLGFIMQGIYIMTVDILNYRGKTGLVSGILLITGMLSLFLTWWLTPVFGMKGVAWGQTIALAVQYLLIAVITQKIEKIMLPWSTWIGYICISFVGAYVIVEKMLNFYATLILVGASLVMLILILEKEISIFQTVYLRVREKRFEK